jgi:hypothetical protein
VMRCWMGFHLYIYLWICYVHSFLYFPRKFSKDQYMTFINRKKWIKGNREGLDMVMYACNSSYMGDVDRRITVQSDPRQKHKTLSAK